MTPDRSRAIREAFRLPTPVLVHVAAGDLVVAGKRESALIGRIIHVQLRRRLVQWGRVNCESPDGIEARDGTLCDECRHPQCRPRLRIYIDRGATHWVLDLGRASARNLLVLEDAIVADGLRLEDCPLRLTVVPRSAPSEVRFERFPPR